ncbi:hypothetical protein RB623_15710 [Mesorhizobium sp. LHD-90]|uniref:hypothetical protein n=1 Tax=Mesorhizobium sp. LHD-90 TaxID=3071414 RepID=UPI0027DFDA3D|nr:hypothetical protein [Mesorhizobium sp. LHD-90]MDQ6435504.1 hypothetical protein [Mesorhizobium sp. LHD-90]
MAPATRIILAVLGVTCAGLALCAALVFGSTDRVALRTAEANIDFLLTQLRDTIEANANLGLQLADVRVVQDLIERAKAADPQVVAVEVFSPEGISLFNTDRGSIGEAISGLWRTAVRYRVENERWRVEEFGNIVVGQAIRNDFGEPIGNLAITVSGAARADMARGVLTGLAWQAAWVAPAALLAVLAVLLVLFGLSSRPLTRLTERLAGEAAPLPDGAATAAYLADADRVRLSVERAVTDFDRAAVEVLKVDESDDRDAA